MEYVDENEIGHLAYIEAVFPDDTVALSEVNYPDSGTYNERELSKLEWKELRPVFIVVQP
jgi:surface antigen